MCNVFLWLFFILVFSALVILSDHDYLEFFFVELVELLQTTNMPFSKFWYLGLLFFQIHYSKHSSSPFLLRLHWHEWMLDLSMLSHQIQDSWLLCSFVFWILFSLCFRWDNFCFSVLKSLFVLSFPLCYWSHPMNFCYLRYFIFHTKTNIGFLS